MNITYFTLREITKDWTDWISSPLTYPTQLVELIKTRYADDFAAWLNDDQVANFEHWRAAIVKKMDVWLQTIAPTIEAKCAAQNEVSIGSSKTTNKFNDTPETAGDYSADEHTTTITTTTASGTASSADILNINQELIMRDYVAEFGRKFIISEEEIY